MATHLASNWLDRRRDQRLPADAAAVLLSYRSQRPVRLRDVSRSGAMVSGADLPEIGDEVVLASGAFEVVATVAWSVAPNCGLAFHRAIDPRALLRGTNALRLV